MHLFGRGDDDRLLQVLGDAELVADEGAGIGHAGGQFGTMEQYAVGPSNAAPSAYDGVKILVVFCGQLVAGYGG